MEKMPGPGHPGKRSSMAGAEAEGSSGSPGSCFVKYLIKGSGLKMPDRSPFPAKIPKGEAELSVSSLLQSFELTNSVPD